MANEKRLDLIDRKALNRKKKYSFQTVGGCFPKSEWFIKVDDLFAAPRVDAVEVVRCKDCKRRGGVMCPVEESVYQYPWFDTKDDGFCSYGERRHDV